MTTPNVLLISIDSLRADYCSFLGAEGTTPNIESFAADCAVFRNAISPSTWTLPVHTSVFTGLYPTEHQVLDAEIEVGRHPTLGEQLRENGYEAMSFGRNNWLEQGGMLRGFDHTTSPRPMAESNGLSGKLDLYSRWLRRLGFRHRPIDEITVENAIESMEVTNEPYCCFVHLNGVHYIYNPPAPYHKEFADRSTPSLMYNLYQQKRLFIEYGGVYPGRQDPDSSFIAGLDSLYRGCVRYSDTLVQKLLTAVESSERDTVVVIFGDHGDSFGERGIFGHQYSVDESVVRVPLLIRDPTRRVEPGEVSDVVQLNDIYPTLLGILGVDPPDVRSIDLGGASSRDMALVHTKPPRTHADKVTSHTPPAELPPETQILGWMSPTEKCIWYPDADRAVESTSGEVRSKLMSEWDSLTPVETVSGGVLSDAARENLKQLGYI